MYLPTACMVHICYCNVYRQYTCAHVLTNCVAQVYHKHGYYVLLCNGILSLLCFGFVVCKDLLWIISCGH